MQVGTSWRELRRARTRERIVVAARRLFLSQGFERTTVQQIAKAADVAVQTLFNHAPSKEALFFLGRAGFGDALTCPESLEDESWENALVVHLAQLSTRYLRSLEDADNLAMAAQIEATPDLSRYERSRHAEVEGELAEVIGAHLPDTDGRLAAALMLAVTRVHSHAYRQRLIAGTDPPANPAELADVLSARLSRALAVAREPQPAASADPVH